MDELSISCDDMQKIEDGEIKATLTWLAQNTAMTLASLSSTSILDRNSREVAGVSQSALDVLTKETRFEAVNLNHIMRSSQNIAEATSPGSVNLTRPDSYQIKSTISPGTSSTVPGTRPKAMIYKFSKLYKTPTGVDYIKLSEFVSKHLATLPPSLKVVVLCDMVISARQLSNELQKNTPVTCYHGGVELFSYGDGTPEYRDRDKADDGGEAELHKWLDAKEGVLVTHEQQFRGCEADAVIFVTRHWDGYNGSGSSRHPVTRAVAHLCLITSETNLTISNMDKHWEVEILDEELRNVE